MSCLALKYCVLEHLAYRLKLPLHYFDQHRVDIWGFDQVELWNRRQVTHPCAGSFTSPWHRHQIATCIDR